MGNSKFKLSLKNKPMRRTKKQCRGQSTLIAQGLAKTNPKMRRIKKQTVQRPVHSDCLRSCSWQCARASGPAIWRGRAWWACRRRSWARCPPSWSCWRGPRPRCTCRRWWWPAPPARPCWLYRVAAPRTPSENALFVIVKINVADPWHSGVDPDPRIHASD